MAAASIKGMMPYTIVCEVPPSTLFKELENQDKRVTPRTQGSGYPTGTPTELCPSLPVATMRARVIAAYFGYLPNGFEAHLSGAEGTPEATAWLKAHYKKIQSNVFSERYGNRSYIQKYVRGKVSTVACHVALTNWTIEARACDLAPPTEAADAATRKIAYMNAITELRQKWMSTYEAAFTEACSQAGTVTGYKHVRLSRARELYRGLKAAAPAVQVDVNTLLTVEDCERAMLVPLFYRTKQQRLAMWKADFKNDKDKLASHLEDSRHVLDVRRFAIEEMPTDPPVIGQEMIPNFLKMKIAHWANSCDIISRYITMYEVSNSEQVLNVDPCIRHAATKPWGGLPSEAFQLIRNLHQELGFTGLDYGNWLDVPIIRMAGQGTKRSIRAYMSEASPEDVDSDDEFVD